MGCPCQQSVFPTMSGGGGNGSGCSSCTGAPGPWMQGGYHATLRNLRLLRKYKRGQPIGFTAKASLKAKGLLPRSNGTRRVSAKYATNKKRSTRRRQRSTH